jgi:YidC/Oxa1 family membrane protein insertase
MRFFYGFTNNWGVAIILLTLLVRICIFPITRTQQVSMQRYSQKMQVLKPKLDELKQKFKDKPQKFAQEQMKLLKEHNAKPPVLGCLSTFITFPVFIGMFQILRTAIELRQAPFAGWIADLSLPDAMFAIPGTDYDFNLLPILATAAFVTQMALAPKPADPQAQQQQKIMLIMPLVFGVMFYGYAAGLSLYMLTSSTYGIIEYKFIRQKFFPPPATASASSSAR